MKLSYLTKPLDKSSERTTLNATITTEHSASSYGQPVIVLPDGEAIGLMSWLCCDYQIEEATEEERESIDRIFTGYPRSRQGGDCV